MLAVIRRWFQQSSEGARVGVCGALAAMLYALCSPYSNFASAGFIDPWFYTGYFSNFTYLHRFAGVPYYVTRLAWILPGVVVFRIAGPETGSLILNAAMIAMSAISVYWIVRWSYGVFPAILSAVVLAASPYFISTVAWDYPDGPAVAFLFVAIALYLRPGGNRAVNSVGGAVFLGLAGHTNMAAGPAIVGGLALLLLLRSRRSLSGLVREGVWLGAGVAGVTILLALISRGVLHTYLFFMGQIGQTLYAIHNPTYLSGMWGTGNGFLRDAFRLVPPVFLLIAGGALLASRRKVRPVVLPLWVFLAVSAAVYAFEEFVLHGVALRVAYHSSYLVVPTFCLAGALFGELWPQPTRTRVAAVALLAALLVWAAAMPYAFAALRPALATGTAWLLLAGAGMSLIVALLLPWRNAVRVAIVAGMVFLLFTAYAVDGHIGYVWNRDNVRVFHALMDIQAHCNAAVPPDRPVRFWFDDKEPSGYTYTSAAALYIEGHDDLTGLLRAGNMKDFAYYAPVGTTLAHLADRPETIVEHDRLLALRGVRVGERKSWRITSGVAPFYLVFENVVAMEGSGAVQR